jgi:hypothetical protein
MTIFKVGDVVKLGAEGVLSDKLGVVIKAMWYDAVTPVMVKWDMGYIGNYSREDLMFGERT